MRLIVFLQGTVIMHSGAAGLPRTAIVAQVRDRSDPTVQDFASYIPVGGAVRKLVRWHQQGGRIDYLSAHRDPVRLGQDAALLIRHQFPPGRILARRAGQSYGDLVAGELPDVLVEDDCESIGADQIGYLQLDPLLRAEVTSIIVPEFGGIDHLPESVADLLSLADRRGPLA